MQTDSKIYKTLKEKANGNIFICLDNDTRISETKQIYKLLNKDRLRGKIRYIRMNEYKDFGEAFEKGGKQGLIDLLSQGKHFTEFELII